MTGRIFRSIFLVACIVLVVCFAVIMGFMYRYFASTQKEALITETALAASGVEHSGMEYFDGLDGGKHRITWVDSSGRVLYDNEVSDVSSMENHADREEIAEALATGVGESERTSETLSERTIYYAKRLSDGSVLRLSVNRYTIVALVLGMLQPLAIILALAIAISAFAASRASKRIVRPFNNIDLDHPLENDSAYKEMAPFLTRLEAQRRRIAAQSEELNRKCEEFAAITDNMSECLILLTSDGTIVAMNKASMQLFGTDSGCIGNDILTLDRRSELRELVGSALEGKHCEMIIDFGTSKYQFSADPVLHDTVTDGVCILAFDVTARLLAETQRREFSANVSHEIKTPLQSIIGSAELIENGLVQEEDMPRFIGHIRSEASRLVMLIGDVIRLSQIDEGVYMEKEPVDLRELAEETVMSLTHSADAKHISLSVDGDAAVITGVRRLLQEMLFNLCDNAVKYNVEGGNVLIDIRDGTDAILLTVKDTGIGIPLEAQGRVFERFYRVDKSHSKDTGGTGLGLSIVKHAALYHGAEISLDSTVGVGTTITVRFKKQ